MQGFGRFLGVVLALTGWNASLEAAVSAPDFSVAQVVAERRDPVCQELRLTRELNIYKDPNLFLSIQGLLYADPERGHEAMEEETPLVTTVSGTFHYMQMADVREFKGFGEIAKLYERLEPRFKTQAAESRRRKTRDQMVNPPMMVPIQICGESPYRNLLGFVLQSDLVEAQKAIVSKDGALPPSTIGNPIPKLKD